jgi:formylglycine-generating enzyme required for sulfatase activity
MAQGGNVYEWEETDFDLENGPSSSARGNRGGHFFSSSSVLRASIRFNVNPAGVVNNVGFRVASIPEPSALLLVALAGLGLFCRRRSTG